MNDQKHDPDIISETENFVVWRSNEAEGYIYHVELGGITMHLSPEEWEELVLLLKSVT